MSCSLPQDSYPLWSASASSVCLPVLSCSRNSTAHWVERELHTNLLSPEKTKNENIMPRSKKMSQTHHILVVVARQETTFNQKNKNSLKCHSRWSKLAPHKKLYSFHISNTHGSSQFNSISKCRVFNCNNMIYWCRVTNTLTINPRLQDLYTQLRLLSDLDLCLQIWPHPTWATCRNSGTPLILLHQQYQHGLSTKHLQHHINVNKRSHGENNTVNGLSHKN